MTYQQYIAYHKGGDAGVEERMIASLARHYCLKPWDAFRLIYYYSMTYHIPSALDMLLLSEGDIIQLHQYPWGRAQGFNSSSSEKRAKFLGMSMADYMQWLWNNPQSGQSPYKLFEGALNPHGKDGDGNLIYTYSGTQF